ncbi:hypothetical protein [Chenggangzhangella methanolivorans]|uniref:hypothetical protein n=1 Tax=Chenggangzhangella methanolivorans TaxID=1437009 RepID=UPI0021BD4F1D|nr:hypothetical protein [Chenggangzhangella methanolivorans]
MDEHEQPGDVYQAGPGREQEGEPYSSARVDEGYYDDRPREERVYRERRGDDGGPIGFLKDLFGGF